VRRVAFLFPGQGAKRVHETLRFVVRSGEGHALCSAAALAADVGLERVIARPSLLDRTEVLQPILTAVALAITERLAEQGCVPDVVLGHSAGEIAAWACAGGLSVEEAIRLSALRGRLMGREAAAHPGGMVALATSDPEVIESALAAGRRAGDLCVAAHNAPDETVLSGDEGAVRALLAFLSATGTGTGTGTAAGTGTGVAVTRVPTSGAWHSPAMCGAVEEWRLALEAIPRRPLRCGFVANRTGDLEGDVAPLLAAQLTHPVMWSRALATVRREASVIVTIGPGAVMRALFHRCSGRAAAPGGPWTLLATEDERALNETMDTLRGLR